MGRMHMFHGLYQADGGQQLGSNVKTEKECCWFFSFTPSPKNQLRCKLQNVVHECIFLSLEKVKLLT